MGAMVAVLTLAVVLVRWWPAGPASAVEGPFRDRGTERISIQEVQPTSQSKAKKPPPPAPLPPVVVPNDVLVEQTVEIGEAELRVETPKDDEVRQEGADRATAARQPDVDARLLRNVQPNYPQAARDDEVRARVEVEIKIDEAGRVEDAHVRRRWRLSGNGTAQPVSHLGYGLEDAALTAARRSRFRPARADGRPVSTRKVITFTFGTN
jgi:outer membrane biosynthesis protein TonB